MRHNIVNKFNRGEVSPDALAREDVDRLVNTCEEMTNFLPTRLGPMKYRQGTQSLGEVPYAPYCVPFVASTTDTAILEFTSNNLRFWVNDSVLTRVAHLSSVTNSSFTSNLTGWTDNSGAGSSTAWSANYGGSARFSGNVSTRAELWQTISADTGVEHSLRVENTNGGGPICVSLGTTGVGSTDILAKTSLAPGIHTLVFTPTANFTITLSSALTAAVFLDGIYFEPAGVLSLPTEISTSELPTIRYSQSADVMFVAYSDGQPYRVERRGTKSWSIVKFTTDDGPFEVINGSDTTLYPLDLSGSTTIVASDDYFTAGHVGGLVKITSTGQVAEVSANAHELHTSGVRVAGVGDARSFGISILGSATMTVTLQRSADNVIWEDTAESWTTEIETSHNDEIDNAILYYRLRVKTGDHTSGTRVLNITYAAGSIDGIARVTTYNSPTSVGANVLQDFGGEGSASATRNWYIGSWSGVKGYPSAVTLYDGRLWFAGNTQLWGSVSDAYNSFDRGILGASRSILRTIGFGPVDTIDWLRPSIRLLMGTVGAEITVRASTLDEPLTQDNVSLKAGSTRGCAPIDSFQIDDAIVFVQRTTIGLYIANYLSDKETHKPEDLTLLHQQICYPGIRRIAVSREPETRIWAVLTDGEVRVFLFDEAENVNAWSRFVTREGDKVKDVIVMPATLEDEIYFVVYRKGTYVLERLFPSTTGIGGLVSNSFDSMSYAIAPGTTIPAPAHLEGDTVGVWADGQDRGDFVVSGGNITVPTSWTWVGLGLRYTADWKSSKISNYISAHVANTRKQIVDLGMIMRNYWPGSVKVGPTVDLLEDMPLSEGGTDVDQTTTQVDYDELPFEFNGEMESDPRICIRATGPCTILALSYGVIHAGDNARTTTTEG